MSAEPYRSHPAVEGLQRGLDAGRTPAARVRGKQSTERAEREGLARPAAGTEFALRELSIRRDPDTGILIVKVIDSKTGEVVRQIPQEEWVRIRKRVAEAKGMLVDGEG